MLNEYQQLYDMEVFGKLNPEVLTNIHNRQALRATNLITEKRCGIIKNTCTDSWPQINYIPREDTSSPTVLLESLFTTMKFDR